MAFSIFKKKHPVPESGSETHPPKIRTRLFTIFSLLLLILVLFTFLVNYSGFTDWQGIDSNLTIFVAVNVNIVLLTTVFYMLLRNLFKLINERKKPFAGVRLKTRLIVAFVALSLPSTAFHLMAGGFMAFLFENWSQGEFKQMMEGSRTLSTQLTRSEDRVLHLEADRLMAYIPRTPSGFSQPDWMKGFQPGFDGGVFIYNRSNHLIAQWVSDQKIMDGWQPPGPQRFEKPESQIWREETGAGNFTRLLLPPMTDNPDGLRMEVMERHPPSVGTALATLKRRMEHGQIFGRDLAVLAISFLVVMTLLIIFAATWIAFYLARGFVTPIERLDDATRRVAEGELGYQVDRSSMGGLEADLGRLVKSFNTMSRQLNEQNLQLLEATEDLRTSHHTLGERNRLVELLLENIDAGIVSLNSAGNITAMNRTAKRMVQLRQDNWENRHYRVVMGKEVVEMLDRVLEQVRTDDKRQLTQNLTLSVKGRQVVIEATLLALADREGQPEGNILLLKDVSAIQRNQRALAWGEVARRVAHEIKNPLTPIQLSAQRIRRRYLDKLDGDGQVLDQCTETIINEVRSLKKMVNEFSQFAKLPEMKPLPDTINAVIQDVGLFYQNGLPENVRLELDLKDGLPLFPIDREQMKRAFTNLIDNAVAALNGSGTIQISTGLDEAAHAVTVEVMDDGMGVPENVRSRIFEPYTSTKEGGTGLGLTIVNQIISDHNGYIRYTDRKPKGTIFSMEFRLQ